MSSENLFCEENYSNLRTSSDILYDSYFEKEDSGSNAIKAKCLFCTDKPTIIKASVGATSNLLTHLKRKHPTDFESYKRRKLDFISMKKETAQDIFNRHVADFFIQTATPLSAVDSASFRKMFEGRVKFRVPSRRSITRIVKKRFDSKKSKIIEAMKETKYFCATADVWSNKHKSFFGYTCHWLNNDLKRVSVALACKRFTGAHTFDRIADMMNEITHDYELSSSNIVATVTDNGSNFVKAFREFGVDTYLFEAETVEDVNKFSDEEESDDNDFDANPFESDDNSELEFSDLANSPAIVLSMHYRCASHTINLIATTDFNAAIKEDIELHNIHQNAFFKCNELWKKANRPKSSEIIKRVLGLSLKTPGVTRWNSLYDSVQQILLKQSLLNELCIELQIQRLNFTDLAYLKEYAKVMKPFATMLDFLQGDSNNYYGMLMPSLTTLKVKTDKLKKEELTFLDNALITIQDSLIRRFKDFYSLGEKSHDAIVAAVSHPAVKLKWFKPISALSGKTEKDVLHIFHQYIAKYNLQATSTDVESPTTSQLSQIFDFGDDSREGNYAQTENNIGIKTELRKFLCDTDTSLDSLKNYPTVLEVFERSNTPLTSSGSVERLFSFGGIVLTPRRNRLEDGNFEKLVLLKANSRT